MKKKVSLKDILIPTLALFLIATICTAILAITNSVTEGKIAENQIKTQTEARMTVFPEAKSFSEDKELDGNTYNEALDENGKVIGYVFMASDKGYGGEVVIMTGINGEGKVTGIQTLELSETAGLGMNAKKEDFRNRFKGKSGPFVVSKDATSETASLEKIDALTGATITSRAVTSAVNKTVEMYNKVTGGENNG